MNQNEEYIENPKEQEAEAAIYTSESHMSYTFFEDFTLVTFHKIKTLLFALLLLAVFIIVTNLLWKDYAAIALSLLLSLLASLLYVAINKSAKQAYERTLLSAGQEPFAREEILKDRIVLCDNTKRTEYFYHQIIGFFETEKHLLLRMQHDLYITVNKSHLSAPVDEVKAFFMQQCPAVKKKRFVDCSNGKKISLFLLVLLLAFSLIGTVAGAVLYFSTAF